MKQIQAKMAREANERFDQQNLKFKKAVGTLKKNQAAAKERKDRVQTANNKRKEVVKKGLEQLTGAKIAGIETKIKNSDRVYENFSAGKNPAVVEKVGKLKEKTKAKEQQH